jgi:hypothetical protein
MMNNMIDQLNQTVFDIRIHTGMEYLNTLLEDPNPFARDQETEICVLP